MSNALMMAKENDRDLMKTMMIQFLEIHYNMLEQQYHNLN